ncbi:DHA1 family inner membrane transport protein [Luteibacter rhizovicinus]|uniref:DHA1 family inner membrane transport protein n=1 Tax=Luteibacter rhizovicinus TaxID=242606 RepID=A0A4R3YTL8_9GAMM|nr:MFS transporter [Luteibacter rhizovicinus]TCV95881.1 DHA1 family inner membrane transport protein [Luteibacter rhizovicinus]
MYLPLLALAIAAFGIGTTEFVIMGLLPEVAADLGVTAPAAGMLVSGYAIGVAIGAPVLALVTARWPRRKALLTLIGMFVLGNVLCAIAPNYGLLMAARVVTAFCHAAFFGIGAVVAADLVPERRAQAVALMFTGLTLANVLGVPFGTALGQVAGWRSTFMAVTLIGVAAAAALALWLPKTIPMQAEQSMLREFRAIATPRVQMALLVSTLASVSMFTVFTYIAYILRDVTHFSDHAKSWVLLLFGAGITVGGLLGGRLADWKLMPVLAALFVCNAVVLAIFAWTSHFQIATLVTLFVWGIFSFAVVPAAQVRVLDQARAAPNLASTLNQGAFNVGNATGAWLGGVVIAAGLPLTNLPLMGAFVALGGLGVVVASALYERRGDAIAHA